MSGMTNLGLYRTGLGLEEEGLKAAQVADRLGLKDAQAWYNLKNTQKKKLDGLNRRAAEGSERAQEQLDAYWALADRPEKGAGVVEDPFAGVDAGKVAKDECLKPKQEIGPVPEAWAGHVPRAHGHTTMQLDVRRMLEAEGDTLRYRLDGERVSIRRKGRNDKALNLTRVEAERMMDELRQLMAQG